MLSWSKEYKADQYSAMNLDLLNGYDAILTNYHTPATTEIAGYKIWDDASNQDGQRPARQDSLSAVKGEHAREHMPQQAKQARPVFADDRPAQQQTADFDGHYHLEHVAQNDAQRQRSPERTVKVGQTGVSAPVVAHVVMENVL